MTPPIAHFMWGVMVDSIHPSGLGRGAPASCWQAGRRTRCPSLEERPADLPDSTMAPPPPPGQEADASLTPGVIPGWGAGKAGETRVTLMVTIPAPSYFHNLIQSQLRKIESEKSSNTLRHIDSVGTTNTSLSDKPLTCRTLKYRHYYYQEAILPAWHLLIYSRKQFFCTGFIVCPPGTIAVTPMLRKTLSNPGPATTATVAICWL